MKRFIISFGLMLYLLNAIFLYCYTHHQGAQLIFNFFLFIPASFPYVIGPTLIDFVVVGIPAWFVFKLALNRKKLFLWLLFIPIILFDAMVVVKFFFETSLWVFYVVRAALMIGCFAVEYSILTKVASKENT